MENINFFVPPFLENLTDMKPKVNIVPNYIGNRPIAFNILLAKNQMDFIYKGGWLKLNKEPIPLEQGKPPKVVQAVRCLLWNKRDEIVKEGSKFDGWEYVDHILSK